MPNVQLRAADGFTLEAYRADPDGEPRGTVVVVQEIFGVYDEAGMKHGFGIAVALDGDLVMADIAAAVDAAPPGPVVVVVGYCFGGTMAARAAIELEGVSAAVGYYGSGIARSLLDRHPRVPLLLQYGEADGGIPLSDVDAVRAAWPEVEVIVHDGAGHGFNCDQRDSFSPAASASAWGSTLAFLERSA